MFHSGNDVSCRDFIFKRLFIGTEEPPVSHPVWIASPCDDKFIFPLCNFRFSGKRWEKQLKPVKRREIKCQKHNSRKCTRFAENSKRCFHNKCEKISFCLSPSEFDRSGRSSSDDSTRRVEILSSFATNPITSLLLIPPHIRLTESKVEDFPPASLANGAKIRRGKEARSRTQFISQ